ncbi:unnamed protein product [Amoebophrya sp. A25]|nr:unnamed protein product [Amoebophrya sp. A25]|eukprot:GSA25T00023710001.1
MFQSVDVLGRRLSDFRIFVLKTTGKQDGVPSVVEIGGAVPYDGNASQISKNLMELWSELTKPGHRDPIKGASLCFKGSVIIPMKACKGELLTQTWKPDLDIREKNTLATQYRRRIIDQLQIDTSQEKRPAHRKKIMVTVRSQTRKFEGQALDSIVRGLQSATGAEVVVRDFADQTELQTIREVHSCDLLIGMHGAALTHAFFLPEGGSLVEITAYPPPVRWRSVANIYMNLAAWTGRQYKAVHALEKGAYFAFDVQSVVNAAEGLLASRSGGL